MLSGHRGLPSARLFTDLDQMEEGEVFTLRILNRTMTYQVDQILIVDPYDMEPLAIDPDQDYCTLVTCTPYGLIPIGFLSEDIGFPIWNQRKRRPQM